jgi:hypothetical protein
VVCVLATGGRNGRRRRPCDKLRRNTPAVLSTIVKILLQCFLSRETWPRRSSRQSTTRGGAVRQLARLITSRSWVRIPPPPLETEYRKKRYPGVMTPRPRPTAPAFRVLRQVSATTCVDPSFSARSLVWTKRHRPPVAVALQIALFRPKSRCLSFAATLGL